MALGHERAVTPGVADLEHLARGVRAEIPAISIVEALSLSCTRSEQHRAHVLRNTRARRERAVPLVHRVCAGLHTAIAKKIPRIAIERRQPRMHRWRRHAAGWITQGKAVQWNAGERIRDAANAQRREHLLAKIGFELPARDMLDDGSQNAVAEVGVFVRGARRAHERQGEAAREEVALRDPCEISAAAIVGEPRGMCEQHLHRKPACLRRHIREELGQRVVGGEAMQVHELRDGGGRELLCQRANLRDRVRSEGDPLLSISQPVSCFEEHGVVPHDDYRARPATIRELSHAVVEFRMHTVRRRLRSGAVTCDERGGREMSEKSHTLL
jgi:hypothetical protein